MTSNQKSSIYLCKLHGILMNGTSVEYCLQSAGGQYVDQT